MKLYMHPASATSRPISLFATEAGLALDEVTVDLMAGEHRQADFLARNPNGLVPLLEDGDFRLSESSAILKYLAERAASPLYPSDLRERARVNERMDWLAANLYRDLGYNLVYPQLFPHHRRRSDEGTDAAVAWGREGSRRWLELLDRHLLGPQAQHLCLDRLTLADFYGSGLVTLGEAIGLDFAAYPNIDRWLAGMKALPSWQPVNQGFYGLVKAMRGRDFIRP